MVKVSAQVWQISAFLMGIFPGSSHFSDLKIRCLVATRPAACSFKVSAGTGWPGVSIL